MKKEDILKKIVDYSLQRPSRITDMAVRALDDFYNIYDKLDENINDALKEADLDTDRRINDNELLIQSPKNCVIFILFNDMRNEILKILNEKSNKIFKQLTTITDDAIDYELYEDDFE